LLTSTRLCAVASRIYSVSLPLFCSHLASAPSRRQRRSRWQQRT
jgi:hypothetical protein